MATKKEMYMAIREMVIANQEMVDFIDKQIELLNRKSSSPKKPTAVQIQNEGFKAEIINYLTGVDTLKCIKELQAEIPSISSLSNQRVTHLLTALVNDKKLEKTYVKRVPYYCIAH